MPDALAEKIAGVAALAEPVRRDLFLFACRAGDWVSREQAAQAVDVPVHTAKFHLDKLVDEGLLDVHFARLSGKTGPGAGRPAKLYRRADRELDVSLPPRNYDLIGNILAEAVEASMTDGVDVRRAATRVARREGVSAGAAAGKRGGPLRRTATALEGQGYEARVSDDEVTLGNCPFHAVAQAHTELVCGINRDYVEGVLEGLGCDSVEAVLEPCPGRCCVVVR